MWVKRVAKKAARELFLHGLSDKTSYLTLPGEDCADVALAKSEEVIGINTRVTGVEMDKSTFNKICLWFEENWKSRLKPRLLHSKLCKVDYIDPVDLVFLDYLGNLTRAEAFWIRNVLNPATMKDAHIGMTIAKCVRGNRFVPDCIEMLKEHLPDYWKETSRDIRDSTRDMPTDLLPICTVYTILIRCYLFPHHDFDLQINYYGEKGSPYIMVLFRLNGVKPVKNGLLPVEQEAQSLLTSLVEQGLPEEPEEEDSIMSKTLKKKRSSNGNGTTSQEVIDLMLEGIQNDSAGKKAAATRKMKQYVAQRKKLGFDPVMVEAGIKSRVSRVLNGN